MDKPRFVLAIILSAAILFGWSLLFPSKSPQPQANTNANTAAADQNASPSPSATQAAAANQGQSPVQGPGGEVPSETTTQRKIKVTTPLYDVVLDNRGAVATSWIIKKNKDNERPLYSVGGTKDQPKALELIPQERVNQEPREVPLRLQTVDGDKNAEEGFANFLLDSRNYEVKELKAQDAREDLQGDNFDIPAGGSRSLEFSLRVSYGPEGKESL